ncbi:hypothetical protein E4U21_004796 [Claviceps maximensis]|nr:hypothetical protein E4U21_004796 [Claviceps maximensis]
MTGGMGEAQLRQFAIRARKNEQTTFVFILALLALGLVFTTFHLVRQFTHWVRRRNARFKIPSFLVAIPRGIRKLSHRRVVGSPSLGHAAVTTLFFVINVVALFVNMNGITMGRVTSIASRSGWLAIANLIFVIFLALKNTPLAFLTAWSYERLNCLHRICGYAAVVHTVIHGSCYSYYFVNAGQSSILLRRSDIMGMVAGGSWVLLALTAIFIRRWWYELFYYLHIILWMVSIVSIGIHQPNLASKVAIGTVVAGSMWGSDRLIRFVRLMFHTVNNSATLTPLPDGGTRVTLAKPPVMVTPGKHAFLWIPHIRLIQTHPFTIVSTDPLEFVIASRDGFTGALHKYAVANPGVRLKASIDGSYGTVPDPTTFETAVLVAGGSGASFVFGLAQALSRKAVTTSKVMTRKVVLVWIVKYTDQLEWFSKHLTTIRNDSRFSIRIFVTRSSPPSSSPPSSPHSKIGIVEGQDFEKAMMRDLTTRKSEISDTQTLNSQSSVDLEKSIRSTSDYNLTSDAGHAVDSDNTVVKYQRPDVAELIREAIGNTAAHESILVSGCGPAKLMDMMRETASDCIRTDGPSIELHCEKFGW